jgi:hypothetical protein
MHEQEGDSSKESESERILQQTLGVSFLQIQVMDEILFILFWNLHEDIDIRWVYIILLDYSKDTR